LTAARREKGGREEGKDGCKSDTPRGNSHPRQWLTFPYLGFLALNHFSARDWSDLQRKLLAIFVTLLHLGLVLFVYET